MSSTKLEILAYLSSLTTNWTTSLMHLSSLLFSEKGLFLKNHSIAMLHFTSKKWTTDNNGLFLFLICSMAVNTSSITPSIDSVINESIVDLNKAFKSSVHIKYNLSVYLTSLRESLWIADRLEIVWWQKTNKQTNKTITSYVSSPANFNKLCFSESLTTCGQYTILWNEVNFYAFLIYSYITEHHNFFTNAWLVTRSYNWKGRSV